MNLTLTERERLAYIQGDTRTAQLCAKLEELAAGAKDAEDAYKEGYNDGYTDGCDEGLDETESA